MALRPLRTCAAVLVLALLGLSACAGGALSKAKPTIHRDNSRAAGGLNVGSAVAILSAYRRSHGLPAVRLDSRLMHFAQRQARAMAARNVLSHDAAGSFSERLREAGYIAPAAAENIATGYSTTAAVMAGWRESPEHRSNMLLQEATRMGIAAVAAPHSRYRIFWALVVAAAPFAELPHRGRGPVFMRVPAR